MLASENELETIPYAPVFCERLQRTGAISSGNFSKLHQWTHLGLVFSGMVSY